MQEGADCQSGEASHLSAVPVSGADNNSDMKINGNHNIHLKYIYSLLIQHATVWFLLFV